MKKKRIARGMWVTGVVFLLCGFLTGTYSEGEYRLDRHLHLVKAGSLQFHNLKKGEKVFVDNNKVADVIHDGDLLLSGFVPGTRTVLVAENNLWPWTKEVDILSSQTSEVSPFLVPQNTSGVMIPKGDKDYTRLKTLIENTILPNELSPKISEDKSTTLSSDGNKIFITKGNDNKIILDSRDLIHNADFLPKRNDVILFATNNGIFAIEIDSRHPQNFQPIAQSQGMHFAIEGNHLYALSGNGTLLELGF